MERDGVSGSIVHVHPPIRFVSPKVPSGISTPTLARHRTEPLPVTAWPLVCATAMPLAIAMTAQMVLIFDVI